MTTRFIVSEVNSKLQQATKPNPQMLREEEIL
jgi:hypothetical protein